MFSVVPFGSSALNPWAPSTSLLTPFGGFGEVDCTFKAMEKEMWNMKRGIDRTFRNFDREFNREFGRDWSSALVNHTSRPGNMIEHYSLLNPIRIDAEGNRWLNCCFDMRSYKPEEINVTVNSKERCIDVEASHEVKDKEHYVKRHYSRKVYIPEDVKIDLAKIEVKSSLTNDGLLCVEAPLPKLSIEEATKANSIVGTVPGNVYPITVKTI